MRRTTRQRILVGFLVFSVVSASLVGYLYWDTALVALFGLLAFSKKFFTVSGLTLLLKKLPFMLLIGSKKLIVKSLGSLLLFSVRTRFRIVRKLIIKLKLIIRRLLRRIRFHWLDMTPWEKMVVYISSIPLLIVALLVFLLFAFVPKTIRNLALKKAQETTAATVINKGVPSKARETVEEINTTAKNAIKKTLLSKTDDHSSE